MFETSRRNLIRGIGAVIMAGATPSFLPRLIDGKAQALPSEEDVTAPGELGTLIFAAEDHVIVEGVGDFLKSNRVRVEQGRCTYAHQLRPGTPLYLGEGGRITTNPLENPHYCVRVGYALPNNQINIESWRYNDPWANEVVV